LLLDALDLPECARVVKRVPKTMLHEHGAPTAADKRQINEGIEQLVWVAVLKPTTIGVAEYRDELREVLEIAVLQLTVRIDAKVGRLIELVLPGVNYLGGSRQLRRRVPLAPPCHGRGVPGGKRALPGSAFQRWSEGF
jgi:hypothetical protein